MIGKHKLRFASICACNLLWISGCFVEGPTGPVTTDVSGDGKAIVTDVGGPCLTSAECPNAESTCQIIICTDAHRCSMTSRLAGSPCDDHIACTIEEKCTEVGICAGKARVCADDNACTDDTCLALGGCTFLNNNSSCTPAAGTCAVGTCAAGKCSVPLGAPCDDGNPCTLDACDDKENCSHTKQSATACDDNDACTIEDMCAQGACNGAPQVCFDGKLCTDDGCDSKKGCQFVNNTDACDDLNLCT